MVEQSPSPAPITTGIPGKSPVSAAASRETVPAISVDSIISGRIEASIPVMERIVLVDSDE